jgi:AcrR family transcriptional regulator
MPRNSSALAETADSGNGSDARARLIEAASDLFVRKGFSGVSIREIAEAAEANSALISYYFGDKQGLFKEVFKAAAEPINAERIVRFERLAVARKVTVEEVVDAWIAPLFEGIPASQEIPVAALSLSLNTEYGKLSEQMIVEVYDTMNERFLELLERCLPEVSRATLVWRLYFLVGAVLTASRQRAASMKSLSKGVLDGRNRKELVRQLVAFTAAGFRGLEPEPTAASRALAPVGAARPRRRPARPA